MPQGIPCHRWYDAVRDTMRDLPWAPADGWMGECRATPLVAVRAGLRGRHSCECNTAQPNTTGATQHRHGATTCAISSEATQPVRCYADTAGKRSVITRHGRQWGNPAVGAAHTVASAMLNDASTAYIGACRCNSIRLHLDLLELEDQAPKQAHRQPALRCRACNGQHCNVQCCMCNIHATLHLCIVQHPTYNTQNATRIVQHTSKPGRSGANAGTLPA